MTIDTHQYLTLGINAARAGQKREAQQYFKAVLKQSPQHVPALFWLAYVAPTPAASMELFERVLKLDPDNERAQAGIRWAQKQIELAAAETATAAETDPAATVPNETAPTRDSFCPRQLFRNRRKRGCAPTAPAGLSIHFWPYWYCLGR
jgi:thioredoxin-like negative regulator of GroEL